MAYKKFRGVVESDLRGKWIDVNLDTMTVRASTKPEGTIFEGTLPDVFKEMCKMLGLRRIRINGHEVSR